MQIVWAPPLVLALVMAVRKVPAPVSAFLVTVVLEPAQLVADPAGVLATTTARRAPTSTSPSSTAAPRPLRRRPPARSRRARADRARRTLGTLAVIPVSVVDAAL